MMAPTVPAMVGMLPMTNHDTVASAKPSVIARIGRSFLASAAAGTVTKMIVQASTVSITSKRG